MEKMSKLGKGQNMSFVYERRIEYLPQMKIILQTFSVLDQIGKAKTVQPLKHLTFTRHCNEAEKCCLMPSVSPLYIHLHMVFVGATQSTYSPMP